MSIIFKGIQLGLLLAFLVGPVFFTIIQTSVERGFLSGVLVAVGVSLSDTLYVTVCYFGLFQFLNEPSVKIYMAYIGGAILIGFGLYHILVKARKAKLVSFSVINEASPLKYISRGFIINGITPTVLLFWIGTLSAATLDFGYTTGYEFFILFTSLLVTVFATDIIKAYLADRLRKIMSAKILVILNIIVGLCLLLFGVRLLLMTKTGFSII
jgi:threonine/homoserine/homoserine lactone efflux protein